MGAEERDRLSLKWGTLKSWNFVSDEAKRVVADVDSRGLTWSMGAATQVMTPAHRQAVCDLIDAVNCDEIYLDWDGTSVSKDEAKRYVMEYRT